MKFADKKVLVTDGRTDQRTDGRTNGPTDGHTLLIEMRGRISKQKTVNSWWSYWLTWTIEPTKMIVFCLVSVTVSNLGLGSVLDLGIGSGLELGLGLGLGFGSV